MTVVSALTAFYVMDQDSLIASVHCDEQMTPAKAERLANYISLFPEVIVKLESDPASESLLQQINNVEIPTENER